MEYETEFAQDLVKAWGFGLIWGAVFFGFFFMLSLVAMLPRWAFRR